MAINRFSPLTQFETSLRNFTGALSSILDSFNGAPEIKSFKQALLQAIPSKSNEGAESRFWQHNESKIKPDRPDRCIAVRLKIEEMRRLSSPTRPICFRCGDKGHIASQCRNAVLCFACNRLGHRSVRCRSLTELSFKTPAPNPHIDPLITSKLTTPTPPNPPILSDHVTGQQISATIQRMEMELAELKHEMLLMKRREANMEIAMAGTTQTPRNLSNWEGDEDVHTTQSIVIRELTNRDDEVGTDKDRDEEMKPATGLDIICAEVVVTPEVNEVDKIGTLHGGRLRPRKGGLRVQGLSCRKTPIKGQQDEAE